MHNRPEEWTKWTAKSRNGCRAYHHTPVIANAVEFGTAVSRWWHELQPAFRKTNGVRPADTFTPSDKCSTSDVWAPLRKGGPNGLVSLMTMLVWWGQAALKPDRWDGDSREDWKATVVDVRRALERMMTTGVKRGAAEEALNPKRYSLFSIFP